MPSLNISERNNFLIQTNVALKLLSVCYHCCIGMNLWLKVLKTTYNEVLNNISISLWARMFIPVILLFSPTFHSSLKPLFKEEWKVGDVNLHLRYHISLWTQFHRYRKEVVIIGLNSNCSLFQPTFFSVRFLPGWFSTFAFRTKSKFTSSDLTFDALKEKAVDLVSDFIRSCSIRPWSSVKAR